MSTGPAELRLEVRSAGLPERGPLVLRREEALLPVMVGRLQAGPDEWTTAAPDPFADEPDDGGSGPTVERSVLLEALADEGRTEPGAFVAGRVRTDGQPSVTEELLAALRAVTEGCDFARMKSRGPACIEAAMAIALLGQPDEGRDLLSEAVRDGSEVLLGQWSAAYYLAQMGDPAGFPALVRMLHDRDDGFTRLMAARHLVAFLPYDGQDVAGVTVDVEAQLIQLLDDRDPLVTREIPALLDEVQPPDLEQVLRPVADGHHHDDTAQAARAVLDDPA